MRKLSLITTLLLLAAVLPARAAKPVSVGGTYQSSYGELDIVEMILMQDGDKVTGNYAYNNGAVEGKLDGRTLTGRWTEDGAAGDFELTFSRDGKSFEGWRTYGDSPEKDSWTGVMTQQAAKKDRSVAQDKGVWVLVGKETGISHPAFVSEDISEYYEDINQYKTVPVNYTFSGTTDDFTISADCKYEFSYIKNTPFSNDEVVTDRVSFHFTETGGFQPLVGPYLPGDVTGTVFHKSVREGTVPDSFRYWSLRGVGLAVFTSYMDGPDVQLMGSRDYVDAKVYSVNEPDESDNFIMPEGNFIYKLFFPKHGSDYRYDDYYVCFQLGCAYDPDNNGHFTKYEYISTVYHFQWSGDGAGDDGGADTPVAEWFRDIFGGGDHTNDLWTIFISGGAASLAIGAVAAALGGMMPPGGAGGAGGSASPGEDPAEERRRRGFLRPDDPDYVRRNVHENPDGSLTLTDPGGGPTQTLYPKLDEEGNRIGWFSQNTEYDDDGIREWARWRSENANTFRQDTAQAERNVAEQRAMNEARDKADRERGSTQMADEIRQWEQRQEHMQKLGDRFGIDPEDEEAMKRAIQRDQIKADMEGGEAEGRAAWWDERVAEAELTEKVCDTIIDSVGEATPQTKAIKTQYHIFKTMGQRTMEGIADNQGAGHLALKVGQGLVEVGIDQYADHDKWKEFKTLDKITGGDTGRTVGGEVLKSLMGDAIDGDKDVSEMIDNAVKAGAKKYTSNLLSDKLGDEINSAELTGGATEAHQNVVNSLAGDWMTQTFSDPLTEDICDELNAWRKELLEV